MKTIVLSIDYKNIDESVIKQAADAFKAGKVVGFPTETVYGIGALKDNEAALKRIYEIKGRPASKPLAIYIGDYRELSRFAVDNVEDVLSFAKVFLPGPVTIIVRTSDGNTQGIRCPNDPVVAKLIECTNGDIVGTSANVSGRACAITVTEVLAQLEDKLDVVIDAGRCEYGIESSIIDFTKQPYTIIRWGTYGTNVEQYFKERKIQYIKKKKILVVCTGNTCRSPMVEGWIRHILEQEHKLNEYEVDSCGVYAPFSCPPSKDAIQLLREEGIDISEHQSQSITKKMVNDADKIVVMTNDHEYSVRELMDDGIQKIVTFDICDPMGRDIAFYKECFELIKKKVAEYKEWLLA